jgi:predicted RNase H-like nuclease
VAAKQIAAEEIIAAGLDGCRAGWVAAVAHRSPERPPHRSGLMLIAPAGAVAGFLADLERTGRPAPVAIDMPMGLPERAGWRPCDRLAREALGPRRSSVFPALDRGLLGLDFAAARAVVLARRAGRAGAGPASDPVMTHEAINLGPKVALLDALLRARPERQEWVLESHPELSFQALAREFDAPAPASKHKAEGRAARVQLIAAAFPDSAERIAAVPWRRGVCGLSDMLDAYAVLWSALRRRRGEAEIRGGARDPEGLVQRLIT